MVGVLKQLSAQLTLYFVNFSFRKISNRNGGTINIDGVLHMGRMVGVDEGVVAA
jgi:hypothetical protein